jgi:2-polyprenyl-3-methyl-5-hydroxy-6-metoxy-1,4-benzoquinol methylase
MRDEILGYIYEQSPTQKKKLPGVLERNPAMARDLDRFLARYQGFMAAEKITARDLAAAYVLMINQVLASRLEFIRTGKYPANSADEAFRNVYDNPKVMTSYMLGLAFSQFLWEHHYAIYRFYGEGVAAYRDRRTFLEVGSGHGLYTLELLERLGRPAAFDIVDISDTSLVLTRGVLRATRPAALEFVRLIKADINAFASGTAYDLVTMGEVLEHVEDPLKILRSLHGLLRDDGALFITTCANCPAIDHVYHFRNVREIRETIRRAGFAVDRELVAPSEHKTPEQIEAMKIDVSYAAFLRKDGR